MTSRVVVFALRRRHCHDALRDAHTGNTRSGKDVGVTVKTTAYAHINIA